MLINLESSSTSQTTHNFVVNFNSFELDPESNYEIEKGLFFFQWRKKGPATDDDEAHVCRRRRRRVFNYFRSFIIRWLWACNVRA